MTGKEYQAVSEIVEIFEKHEKECERLSQTNQKEHYKALYSTKSAVYKECAQVLKRRLVLLNS